MDTTVTRFSKDTNGVFVSYARADQFIAERLVADLHEREISVWIDRKQLSTGVDWELLIRDAIQDSSGVWLLASPNSRLSRNVRDEIAVAQILGHPVYPIWI